MARKDRINKQATSDVKRDPEEFEIAGNARLRGEDPSPDDRARGERSVADPAGPVDRGRG
jgi:hypothetical protein